MLDDTIEVSRCKPGQLALFHPSPAVGQFQRLKARSILPEGSPAREPGAVSPRVQTSGFPRRREEGSWGKFDTARSSQPVRPTIPEALDGTSGLSGAPE